MNNLIENHPTVLNARAEIARDYKEYNKAVINRQFRRATDLNKSIKRKERDLRRTIKNMERSL